LKMSYVMAMNHNHNSEHDRDGEDLDVYEQIRFLTEKIEGLEKIIERYAHPPSDMAAQWRKRLAAINSPFVVLTMDANKKPMVGEYYKIIRVETSDPDYFLVTTKGAKLGKKGRREDIETWISSLEDAHSRT